MPIVQLLTSSGFFDPEATKILTVAFDTSWQMLKTSGNVLAADFRAGSTREFLAKRIIETARQGERDPIRLAEDALAYLATLQAAPPETKSASAVKN
jgi:hypothetical protein